MICPLHVSTGREHTPRSPRFPRDRRIVARTTNVLRSAGMRDVERGLLPGWRSKELISRPESRSDRRHPDHMVPPSDAPDHFASEHTDMTAAHSQVRPALARSEAALVLAHAR